MKVISQLAIDRIKGNNTCVAKLMILFNGKHHKTIMRWMEDRDVRLISPSALEIIIEETGLKEKDILETDDRRVTQRH